VQLLLAVKPLTSRMEKRDKLPVDAELKRRIQELLAYKGGGHNPDLVEDVVDTIVSALGNAAA